MYKFFVGDSQINGNKATILNEDVSHIVNVLRLKKEDKIIICSKSTARSYIAQIEQCSKEKVECSLIQEKEETTESFVEIDVYQGLPKMDKMEFIIQKATEIGARNIYPVKMERCVVKLNEESTKKKIDRWQKIAEVSAKQSKRDIIPTIKSLTNIKEICQNSKKYDIILLAYENEEKTTIKQELKKLIRNSNLKIAIIVGPEGGMADEEVKKLTTCRSKECKSWKKNFKNRNSGISNAK